VSVTALAAESSAQTASPSRVAVVAEAESLQLLARELADELRLPWFDLTSPTRAGFDFLLVVRADGLAIAPSDPTMGGPLGVDFVHGPTAYRRVAAGGRRQSLALAVGLKHGRPSVLDATAGLGRDTFLLACLGCRVTAVERSPILSALLRDGLERARSVDDAKLNAVLERIALRQDDSRNVLRAMQGDDAPDVVYVDPMYVPQGKAALVKKEMRICRMLVGDDRDAGELFDAARAVARQRVVVKRHRQAAPLAPGVSVSHRGRVVRYDVYVTKGPSNSTMSA
jgi:16S rRNA (guanine1516-N2)-methyltransferase